MEINAKIRMLREMNDWTQEQMAEKLHMSLSSYAKIERGIIDVPFKKLEKIAEVFDIHLIDLLSLNKQRLICLSNKEIIGNNSGHINYYADNDGLAKEIEKLQIIINCKDELLRQKDELISQQKQYIQFLTSQNIINQDISN